MRPVLLPLAFLALSVPAAAEAPARTPAERALRAHVAYLASDELHGREAGTPDYDKAAAYVAAQFRAAGLRPAGDAGSFLQRVPLVRYALAGPARATIDGRALPAGGLAFAANPAARATRVAAPVVFAGYGIDAADGHDDYAGLDVRGRIVAVLAGVPKRYAGDDRAFLSSIANKAAFAARRGAVGVVEIVAKLPTRAARPRVGWAEADGTAFSASASAPVLATLADTAARRLFARRPGGFARVAAARDAGGDVAGGALDTRLSIESATAFTPMPSSNVVGVLPGADPRLAREIVVLSAHLDHIGVSETPDANGDAINNGAMDDAIGVASLIEEARRFAAAPRPKRSILFLAVTAEEKGLVGSDYFVRHPPRALGEIVADVNLDMPILTYPFEDLVAFGGDRSTLGPAVARGAAAVGVTMSPDPVPDMGIFVRSDHFRFVQAGIPSLFLWPGHKGPGKAAYEAFFATRYHQPADDLSQPIRWDQGVRFVAANYRIAREIADAPARPEWNRGEYFQRLYGGPVAP